MQKNEHKFWLLVLLSACIVVGICSTALAAEYLPSEIPEVAFTDWLPQEGDSFVVNTSTNIGYLVHPNGGHTSFKVATGQRRVVYYNRTTYFAATPLRRWKVISTEVKSDRTTFGPEGTFLRLGYGNDYERTPYGIHSHRSIDAMLSEDLRYRSMGCILVSLDVMHVIEKTFAMNQNNFRVVTVSGFSDSVASAESLLRVIVGS